jgi:hypothetical protein
MAKSRKGLWVFLILAVLVVVFVFGGIKIFEQISGVIHGGLSSYDGGTAVCFKVNFKDGTSKDYSVKASGTMMIFAPMTILVEGKEIASITIYVKGLLTASDVTQWTAKVTQQTEFYLKPATTPKGSATATYTQQGSEWTSGTEKVLSQTTLAMNVIDNYAKTFGNGNWLMQVNCNVELTLTAGGTTKTVSAKALSGGIDFTYRDDSVVSLTANVSTEPLYP